MRGKYLIKRFECAKKCFRKKKTKDYGQRVILNTIAEKDDSPGSSTPEENGNRRGVLRR